MDRGYTLEGYEMTEFFVEELNVSVYFIPLYLFSNFTTFN